jgi:hypothetical protein
VNMRLFVHGTDVREVLKELRTRSFPLARKWISPIELQLKV